MPPYEVFGKFYDAVMGDRARPAKLLHKIIRKTKPDASNLLELGCGTGSMLKYLQRYYEVSGLDTSSRMLSIARRKVPRAKLFQQDMVGFHVDDHFDVICCVFDSINETAPHPIPIGVGPTSLQSGCAKMVKRRSAC